MVAMLAELGGLSDQSEEAVWEVLEHDIFYVRARVRVGSPNPHPHPHPDQVLENYIFYVVMPFLTDFFTADVPLVPPSDAPLASAGGLDNDSARSLDVSAVPSNDEDQARYGEM